MFISKKKLRQLEKRIADLENELRSQRKEINFSDYPYESVKKAFAEVSHQN